MPFRNFSVTSLVSLLPRPEDFFCEACLNALTLFFPAVPFHFFFFSALPAFFYPQENFVRPQDRFLVPPGFFLSFTSSSPRSYFPLRQRPVTRFCVQSSCGSFSPLGVVPDFLCFFLPPPGLFSYEKYAPRGAPDDPPNLTFFSSSTLSFLASLSRPMMCTSRALLPPFFYTLFHS